MNPTDKNTNKVNNQIVLRDAPNGMPVRTRIKAGLKIKMAYLV